MKLKFALGLLLVFFTTPSSAAVKIGIIHGKTEAGVAKIKIKNKTNIALACYVAVDGQKINFHIDPFLSSKWYQAADSGFNYRHFITWCDQLSLYPEYKP